MVLSTESVGGIDEAGRGAILGPLVVAGVSANSKALTRLAELGVRDSKLLTHERRCALYEEITSWCDAVSFLPILPEEIDRYVTYGRRRRKLNFLEAIHMARIVPLLGVDQVYIDAPDTNARLFTTELKEMLRSRPCPRIVAEHKADRNYVVVSAASIVAKVERDAMIRAWDPVYPFYGLASNKGYATPRHIRGLREHGPSPMHRQSFAPVWMNSASQELLQFMLEDEEAAAGGRNPES